MKREMDIDKYNELCDKIRSIVLYAKAFRKKSEKREKMILEIIETSFKNELELVTRIKSLEGLVNNLCEIKDDKSDS